MTRRSHSTGMAIVTAIFLIVVLAGLGLAMSSISNVQQDTENKSVLAAKVYYGARAGLDWGIQQAVAGSSCAASTNWGPGTNPMQGALSDVSVTVTCTSTTYTGTNKVYYFTSNATVGTLGGVGYAQRQLEAAVSNVP